MTERQHHILRILADPCSAPNGLHTADREAIAAALDSIDELQAALQTIAEIDPQQTYARPWLQHAIKTAQAAIIKATGQPR